MQLHFLIPGDLNTLTGGYIYDKRIVDGLLNLGHKVRVHSLAPDFPFPSNESMRNCEEIIKSIPTGEIVVIDSLVFGTIPQLLREAKLYHFIVALIHLPLSVNSNFCYDPDAALSTSEKEAFFYCNQIIVTSEYTADLLKKMSVDPGKIKVVIPGVEILRRKTEYAKIPRKLITVSNYTRNKGFKQLFEAITQLRQFDWELNCYGSAGFDVEYVNELKIFIENNRMTNRIIMHKSIHGVELSKAFQNSDVLIHPSEFETYGMVLTEALAHGIPVIASSGGAIKNTVPELMGLFFEQNNVASLRDTIQLLFQDTNKYRNLCKESNKYINQAQLWKQSILEFENVLKRMVNKLSLCL